MTEAGDQMNEAQEEPNQILGFPNIDYSDQNSPHIDAEKATVEKSNEECCQEQQTLRSRSWHLQFEQAESQQMTLPQDHHHHQT